MSFLVDTSVLVDAHDRNQPAKQQRARQLLESLADRKDVFLSAQVLAEFFRVVSVDLERPLSLEQAQAQVENLRSLWPILSITEAVVVEAVRGVALYGLHFWDAQTWATARLSQISHILSEDFEEGHLLETVRFVNPFREPFDISQFG